MPTREPTEDILERLAMGIAQISSMAKAMRTQGLKSDALVALLQGTPACKGMTKKTILLVLDGLERLEERYLVKEHEAMRKLRKG